MSKSFQFISVVVALMSALMPLTVTGAESLSSQDALVATIQSQAAPAEKWAAAQQLSRVGTPAVVSKIVDMLSNPETSDLARYVLETIPGAAVDEALLQALPKLKSNQLVGVIASLGVRRDRQAVEPLAKFLRDPDPTVASAAMSALGRIGTRAAAKTLADGSAEVAATLKLELYSAMLSCANTLRISGDAGGAIEVCKQVRGANLPAAFRAGAVQCAILADTQGGISLLSEALQDPDGAVFNAVLYLVQRDLPKVEVTVALTRDVTNLPISRQILIIPAIAVRGGVDAQRALSELSISAKDGGIRLEAVKALAAFADAAAVLGSLATDSDVSIAKAARETLASLPGTHADEAILSMLSHPDSSRRVLGAQLAERRRLRSAISPLLVLASDPSVGNAAVAAISEIAADPDLAGVVELFGRIPASSVQNILGALCSRADHPEACAAFLVSKMTNLDAQAQCAVLRTLPDAGGAIALEAEASWATNANPEIRSAAILSLAQWKTVAAGPVLIRLAKTVPEKPNKASCLRGALTLAGLEDAPPLDRLAICRDANGLVDGVDEKKLLLSALGTLPLAEAFGLISPYLENPTTRSEAASAVLAVAGRLLQGPQAGASADAVAAAVSKIVQAPPTPDIETRAKAVLEQAVKAGGKLPPTVGDAGNAPSFFPFCIDWHDAKKRSFSEQAIMLKELGYDGVGHIWLDGVADRLKTLDDAKLKLFQITMTVDLTPGKPAYDAKFKEVLDMVKVRGVQFDLLINGAPPSDPAADAHGVEVLREMSDLAKDSSAQLLLYPHVGCWVERVEDACRVAEKVDRPNVGVMFNLCHWLRVDKQRDYKPLLQKAMPRLWAVSINGADELDPNPGWEHYIQPLGQGSFDMVGFLKTLRELGYKGPIGLQCYGIGGDARDHLARSMAAWRKLNAM